MGVVLRNAVIVPVEPRGVVHDRGWLRVDGAEITGIGPGTPPNGAAADRVIDASGGLVLPGLVSAHQHLLDVLLRGGLPCGPSFLDWLLGLYYEGMAEYRPADAALATTLGIVETLRAGVTCLVDNWGVDNGSDAGRVRACAEASIEAYSRSGIRTVFARMFATRIPGAWRRNDLDHLIASPDAALGSIEELMSAHDGSEGNRIRVCPAPELPEMVHPEALRGALELARSFDTVMPMHLLASPDSRAAADAKRLDDIGVLDPRLLGAHCTAATPADLELLARRGVKIAHCPTSNAFLGGAADVAAMLAEDLVVGLGSDNATLNCNSDILAEMRRAVLTSRVIAGPSSPLTASKVLEMATIDGARAAGLAGIVGSLLPGKAADLVLLDTSGPHWWPHHDWIASLVFQAKSTDVRTVLVNGRLVMDDRELGFLDADAERRLCEDAQKAALRVAGCRRSVRQ
jgi:cytosine/adenosine deaminase-related metal-dependent hydrolase